MFELNTNKMKSVKLLFFLILFSSFGLKSQTHWVVFTDKKDTSFDPYEYFDKLAIERRLLIGYDLYDYSDFPLNEGYISIVEKNVDSISYSSRWMNALSVWADDNQIYVVSLMPFVKEIVPISNLKMELSSKKIDFNVSSLSKNDSLIWDKQLKRMGGDLYKTHGVDGKGVRIAVFDAGFPYVDTHSAFQHLREGNRIIKTRDFVRKRDFVYSFNSHGSMVLSAIAGIYENKEIGMATGAEFLLARTEKESEPFSEEVNWVAAMEWADKNGAHIINSSLGYTYHRYFPTQMDGKTAFVSRMANTAASKGLLVINAAGNEGDSKWKFIGAPADADSIISVGGIDPLTDKKISFSSLGPTADFRLKPNVVAFGHVLIANKSGVGTAHGTSFAAPLVSGFAACAKQLFPDLNAMQLKELIERSADLYPYFDYAHGYGVPQASKIIFGFDNSTVDSSFSAIIDNKRIKINILDENNIANSLIYDYSNFMYYSVLNNKDIILEYGVLIVHSTDFIFNKHSLHQDASKVRFHFRGQTIDINLN